MAAGDTNITLVGNLVDDPELRFTPSGQAVAKFRVASTPRYRDQQSGEWKDGEALFLTCNIWRQAAENVAESLQRGARVIVQGRLKQRSYETKEGEKRTVFEVEVDEVGPSLRYATARISKTTRSGGFGGQPADDPWATATPAATSASAPSTGWGGNGAGVGGHGSSSGAADEPPF
jgi:single-strand DNA-binding protein